MVPWRGWKQKEQKSSNRYFWRKPQSGQPHLAYAKLSYWVCSNSSRCGVVTWVLPMHSVDSNDCKMAKRNIWHIMDTYNLWLNKCFENLNLFIRHCRSKEEQKTQRVDWRSYIWSPWSSRWRRAFQWNKWADVKYLKDYPMRKEATCWHFSEKTGLY